MSEAREMPKNLQPEILETPKAYWVDQRLNGYSNWAMPFWRELFQNEVDANATRIDISLEEVPARGAFGEAASLPQVVRVKFRGNGKGMDERTLREVFFRPGASSKRGDPSQIGGFGTARIMLCWSQVRYAIRTNGLFVEGDGSRYTCRSFQDEIAVRSQMVKALEESGAHDRAEMLRTDIAHIQGLPPKQKGCEFEIDINPKEASESYRNVGRQRLRDALDEYLHLSQLPCKVYLNGEELTEGSRRGPARRKLVVSLDGQSEPVEFATVHISESKKAKFRGSMIVRVNGAMMYLKRSDFPQQVIVELKPEMARQVLTDARDNIKSPFSTVLEEFTEKLSNDRQTALDEVEERKHEVVVGALGGMRLRTDRPKDMGDLPEGEPDGPKSFVDMVIEREREVERGGPLHMTPEQQVQTEVTPQGAVEYMRLLLRKIRDGGFDFVGGLPESQKEEGTLFVGMLKRHGVSALADASPAMATWLYTEIAKREAADLGEQASGVVQIHDLHIHREDTFKGDDSLKLAMRTHHPRYWRTGTKAFGGNKPSRWSGPHMLFSVWTSCVRYALDVLLNQHPHLSPNGKPLQFATGWYFAKGQEEWDSATQTYQVKRTLALHKVLKSDTPGRPDVHAYLLNPVLQNGKPAFNLDLKEEPVDPDGVGGIGRLIALAKHEVAHTVSRSHNEDFARTLTQLDMAFSQLHHIKGVNAAARAAVEAVQAAYGRGRVRIQAIDDNVLEQEALPSDSGGPVAPARRRPRPAEALLAHAAPRTMAAIGVLAAPENAHLPSAQALSEQLEGIFTHEADGTVTVDATALLENEEVLQQAIQESNAPKTVAAPPAAESLDASEVTASADAAWGDLETLVESLPQGQVEESPLQEADSFLSSLGTLADDPPEIPETPPLSTWADLDEQLSALSLEHSESAQGDDLDALASISISAISIEEISHAISGSSAPNEAKRSSTPHSESILGEDFTMDDIEATADGTEDLNQIHPAPEETPGMPALPEDPALDILFDMEISSPDKGPSLAP